MLVTSRIATGDGEPSKDRLIFSLDKPQVNRQTRNVGKGDEVLMKLVDSRVDPVDC